MTTGRRVARPDAGRAAEVESVGGEARFQTQLAQPEVDLVEILLAFIDFDGAAQERRTKGSRDLHIDGELAGCAIYIGHIQGDEIELRGMGMQLAPYWHIVPVGPVALGFEVAFDRTDLAILQLRLRIDD